MPIEYVREASTIRVRQSFLSPTVYLDHWAIRMFSDDLELQHRFVEAMQRKGGTLLLSSTNFAEFSNIADARHVTDTENLLERLMPNVFLTDFAMDKLLAREKLESTNTKRFWPPADLPQLKLLAETSYPPANGLTIRGFLKLAHTNRAGIAEATAEVAQMLRCRFEAARRDEPYVRKARKVKPSAERPRTLLILGELMRGYFLDPAAPISDNDMIDLMHAAIPVNCCDYVLLDAAWVERVRKMKRRIANVGLHIPLADCFSKKDDGVGAFLNSLEAFNRSAIEMATPL